MHINKARFLWLIVGFASISIFLFATGIACFIGFNFNTIASIIFVSFLLGALVLMILAVIYYCIFIYKMWSAIGDGITRPKPGTAVGFLFIPYFNLGWIFVALAKFPFEYNRYIERHQLSVPSMKKGVHIALPVVDLSWIVVGMVTGLTVAFQVMVQLFRQLGRGTYYYDHGYHNWQYNLDYQFDWQQLINTMIVFGAIYVLMMVTRFVLTYLFISRGCDAINALPELAKPPQPVIPPGTPQ